MGCVVAVSDVGVCLGVLNEVPENPPGRLDKRDNNAQTNAWHRGGPAANGGSWRLGLVGRLGLVFVVGMSILAATILVASGGFKALDKRLQSLIRRTLPASAIGYEMEINLLGSGMGVLKYLSRDDPSHRQWFVEDRAEFQQFLEQFKALAEDPETAAALRQVSQRFDEFQTIGARLMAARDAERAGIDRLGKVARELNAVIHHAPRTGAALDVALVQLNVNTQELIMGLLVYLKLGDPISLELLDEETQELRQDLAAVRALAPPKRALEEIKRAEAALAETQALLAGYGMIDADIAMLIELRRQMDDPHDEGIQVFTASSLAEANRLSRAQIAGSLTWMLIFAGLAGAIGVAAAWVFLTDVVRPIRMLRTAAAHYAQGDLSYRSKTDAVDELGLLSRAMNDMADELQFARAQTAEINAGLEQQVVQRTQALAAANRELAVARDRAESASRAKSVFLEHMSHELRTPLNAVLAFAEVMRDEMFGPLGSDKYKTYAKDIHDSGSHLLTILSHILDLAQIDTGEMAIKSESVNVQGVIGDCHASIAAKAGQSGLDFQISADETLPPLRADAARLRQVIENLAGNAVKFTEPGGWVRITAGRAGDGDVVIAVSDSGPGMRLEEIVRALEMVTPVNVMVARPHAGAGLGLPVSNALAELMGARLLIDSKPGVGTTVSVVFPPSAVIEG